MDIAERIIQMVKQHRCLYDLHSDEYKLPKRKDLIWAQIGRRVHLSAIDCKKRWKGLRDTYVKRKRAEQNPSSGAEFSKKWKYMDRMRFLDDCQEAKGKTGNVIFADMLNYSEFPSIKDEEILSGNLESFDGSMTTTEDEVPAVAEANEPAQPSNRSEPYKNQADADSEVVSKFQKIMEECANSVKELSTSTRPAKPERNATSLLFESLAKTISEASIPIDKKRKIECQVVQFVYKELAECD